MELIDTKNTALTNMTGLTDEEAAQRISDGLANNSADEAGRSVFQIIAKNLFTFFNLINLLLAAALALVGSFRNMLFLGTVCSNAIIGIIQELRTRKTLRKLRLMNEEPIRVFRNGTLVRLLKSETVRDDLICLQTGDQVPADCIVRGGKGSVNEAMLTGESDSIEKQEGDNLLSGSFVTSGSIIAQQINVGSECYAAKIVKEGRMIRSPKSKLIEDMRKLIHMITMLMLPAGILLFIRQYLLSKIELIQAVPSAVGAMVGMIPNGLVLLVSVALMVGVIRLGKKRTLVQELYGIETLARADVLCLDKTGTLTTGEMRVERLIPTSGMDEKELSETLGRFLGAFEEQNSTSKALAKYVRPVSSSHVGILPFSSARKYSAVGYENGEIIMMGAPTFVWRKPFPNDVQLLVDSETAEGNRVLLLCAATGMIEGEKCPEAKEVLGVIVLSDEIRESAKDTLDAFSQQGVGIRIISGDDPKTVSMIAKRLGVEYWEKAIDVSDMSDEELKYAAEEYTVFGRVSPNQKQLLVEALKANGNCVGMTGDGVNDIPAMKAADCSIAMASGSDAARHAAMVTLLDSDFAALPEIVNEGRRVVNNVTRAASLFLVKTLYSLGLALIMVFLPLRYPFQPIQLTLVSTFTIGLPSLFLALEPNRDPIRGSFLKNVLRRALPGSIGVFTAALIAMLLERFGMNSDDCSTVAALCAAATGIMMLANTCYPFTRMRTAVLAGMSVLIGIAIIIAGNVFRIPLVGSSAGVLAAAAGGILVCGLAILVLGKIMRRSELKILDRLGIR